MLLTCFSSFAFSFIDYEIGRIFVSIIIFYIEVKGKLVDFLSIKVVRISIISKLHINIMYREECYTKKKNKYKIQYLYLFDSKHWIQENGFIWKPFSYYCLGSGITSIVCGNKPKGSCIWNSFAWWYVYCLRNQLFRTSHFRCFLKPVENCIFKLSMLICPVLIGRMITFNVQY